MTEEKKETCKCSGNAKSAFKILFGVIILVAGLFLCVRLWPNLLSLIKACLGPMLVLVGLVIIAIAKE